MARNKNSTEITASLNVIRQSLQSWQRRKGWRWMQKKLNKSRRIWTVFRALRLPSHQDHSILRDWLPYANLSRRGKIPISSASQNLDKLILLLASNFKKGPGVSNSVNKKRRKRPNRVKSWLSQTVKPKAQTLSWHLRTRLTKSGEVTLQRVDN